MHALCKLSMLHYMHASTTGIVSGSFCNLAKLGWPPPFCSWMEGLAKILTFFFTFQGNFDNDQSLADLAIFPDCISEGKMILAKLDIKKTRCWQEDTMRIIPGTFLMLLLVCPKHCNWKLFGLTRQDRVCLNDRPVVSPCLDQDKSELWKSEIFNKLTLPHLKQSYFINEH